MRKVNNWLITWTACVLKHPKLCVCVPILATFLLAYTAIYDFTLRPLNGRLLAIFDDCTLSDGGTLTYQPPHSDDLSQSLNYTVTDVTFRGSNILKYETLLELSDWTRQVSGISKIVTPLLFISAVDLQDTLEANDKRKLEKCFLKVLNHDFPVQLVQFLFDNIGRQNHMINSAQIMHVTLLSEHTDLVLPRWDGPSLKQISTITLSNVPGSEVLAHFASLSGNQLAFGWISRIVSPVQVFLIAAYLLRVYLSIRNNHKMRSNVGLIIGWLNGVAISAFASLTLFSSHESLSVIPSNSIVVGFYLLVILILSSRNLFRTVNDLAGDSGFGEPESLHKRLIKFYLGFNSSVENSQGVFHVSSFIRRTLHLDSCCYMAPIPNTSIILLINISGFTLAMGACAFVCKLSFDAELWLSFWHVFLLCSRLTIVTLIIDHLLQLTYMVAIVVIDLHRVDFTDVLEKVPSEDVLDTSSSKDGVFLAFFLKSDFVVSLRYRLVTLLLKVSLHSTKLLWLELVPSVCVFTCISIAWQARSIQNISGLRIRPSGSMSMTTIVSTTNDSLYYLELIAVVIFIVAISELTFTLLFSERQKQNLKAVCLTSQTEVPLSDLTNIDDTRKFQAISLSEKSRSEKLCMFANPNAPYLVTTDLNHQVLLWSPMAKTSKPQHDDLSTVFETNGVAKNLPDFWPVNHAEISNEGEYVVLINNRNCRIKCYSRTSRKFMWEISLKSELSCSNDKMNPILTFFRRKTVAGFMARELLLRRRRLAGKSYSSNSSLNSMHGNYQPPLTGNVTGDDVGEAHASIKNNELNREEFVMVLESGEMITISCDSVKVKVYNLLSEVFPNEFSTVNLRILSSKFLSTSRVNDRVVCAVSNDEVIIGSSINNTWRFSRLEIRKQFTSHSPIVYAPPSMSRGTWTAPYVNVDSANMIQKRRSRSIANSQILNQEHARSSLMNRVTVVTIDFVGMFVRVKELQAQLIDIQTGTILRSFHIGSFKPGTFRVSHSEPTHCKFCGCVSFKTVSLIYEDLYEKTLIVHTLRLESKKSRNNICLRVERDPLEIRCLGFDSAVESQYWFDDIEMWELTDMNVVVGVRRPPKFVDVSLDRKSDSSLGENGGLSTLRNRKSSLKNAKSSKKKNQTNEVWQGFVVTVSDGKILDYKIPERKVSEQAEEKGSSERPNLIVKFGFKAVAIAFGHEVKIIYLGNDKLIENDLYYSGSVSTINPLLRSGTDGTKTPNELLFINKRRRMVERRIMKSGGHQEDR